MTWNYRIIKHGRKIEPYFAVHEVFYDERGKIESWTENPVDIVGDSVKDVTKMLETILKDIKQPVLKESELQKKLNKTGKNRGEL